MASSHNFSIQHSSSSKLSMEPVSENAATIKSLNYPLAVQRVTREKGYGPPQKVLDPSMDWSLPEPPLDWWPDQASFQFDSRFWNQRHRELRHLTASVVRHQWSVISNPVGMREPGLGKAMLVWHWLAHYRRFFSGGVYVLWGGQPELVSGFIAAHYPQVDTLRNDVTPMETGSDALELVLDRWRCTEPQLLIVDGLTQAEPLDSWLPQHPLFKIIMIKRAGSSFLPEKYKPLYLRPLGRQKSSEWLNDNGTTVLRGIFKLAETLQGNFAALRLIQAMLRKGAAADKLVHQLLSDSQIVRSANRWGKTFSPLAAVGLTVIRELETSTPEKVRRALQWLAMCKQGVPVPNSMLAAACGDTALASQLEEDGLVFQNQYGMWMQAGLSVCVLKTWGPLEPSVFLGLLAQLEQAADGIGTLLERCQWLSHLDQFGFFAGMMGRDYPVFCHRLASLLLVLGHPKGAFTLFGSCVRHLAHSGGHKMAISKRHLQGIGLALVAVATPALLPECGQLVYPANRPKDVFLPTPANVQQQIQCWLRKEQSTSPILLAVTAACCWLGAQAARQWLNGASIPGSGSKPTGAFAWLERGTQGFQVLSN